MNARSRKIFEVAGWTADSIGRIIEQMPIVRISWVDDSGCVCYDAKVINAAGPEEEHSLIVYDDNIREFVGFPDE